MSTATVPAPLPETVPTAQDAFGSHSVAAFYLRVLTDFCDESGLDPEPLLATERLSLAHLARQGARVGIDAFVRLCNEASRRLDVRHIGLHLGRRMRPGYLGPYGFMLLSCADVRQMTADFMRYSAIAVDVGRNFAEERDGQRILTWVSDLTDRHPANRLLGELLLSSQLSMLRLITGQASLVPSWIELPHPRPSELGLHHETFGCDLRFGAPRTAMAVEATAQGRTSTLGNPEVHATMAGLCERLLQTMDRAGMPAWLTACRRAIADMLEHGMPGIGEVADSLGMSQGSLRLGLEKAGTTFQGLVADLRRDLAVAYLEDAALSLTDVTHMLGFSEQSAFQRAFKRWTGVTPGDYRKRLRTH